MPDLLIIRSGKEPIWIELKVDRNRLRRTQRLWIRNHPEETVLVATLFEANLWIFYQKELEVWEEIYKAQWLSISEQEVTKLITEQ